MQNLQTLRIVLAFALALITALVILYAMLAYLSYRMRTASSTGISDDARLQTLATLRGESTTTVQERFEALAQLSDSASISVPDVTKYDALESLH